MPTATVPGERRPTAAGRPPSIAARPDRSPEAAAASVAASARIRQSSLVRQPWRCGRRAGALAAESAQAGVERVVECGGSPAADPQGGNHLQRVLQALQETRRNHGPIAQLVQPDGQHRQGAHRFPLSTLET